MVKLGGTVLLRPGLWLETGFAPNAKAFVEPEPSQILQIDLSWNTANNRTAPLVLQSVGYMNCR